LFNINIKSEQNEIERRAAKNLSVGCMDRVVAESKELVVLRMLERPVVESEMSKIEAVDKRHCHENTLHCKDSLLEVVVVVGAVVVVVAAEKLKMNLSENCKRSFVLRA
jgi:hypothetical protein